MKQEGKGKGKKRRRREKCEGGMKGEDRGGDDDRSGKGDEGRMRRKGREWKARDGISIRSHNEYRDWVRG